MSKTAKAAVHDSDPQRQTICRALVELVVEHGYDELTVELVAERAAVDRAAFDRRFSGLEQCAVEAWQRIILFEMLPLTSAAYEVADNWLDGLRATAWAFCRFIQEDHARAHFVIVSSFNNEILFGTRDFVMRGYAEMIHLGRFERPQAADLPSDTADAIVGAIWEAIATRINADAFDELPSAVPQMMYVAVLPYLGPAAAQRELRRAPQDIARYERSEL